MLIRPDAFWRAQAVTLWPGRRVIALDPEKHEVSLEDGARMCYGNLIWATGGRPRRLTCPGSDLPGVHTVRKRADVDRMITELIAAKRIVVVGSGYIGLEVAATLTKLGKQVTVLEAMDRVLARVAGEPLSRFYEREHRAYGVDIRLRTQVQCLETGDERVGAVRLGTRERLPSDMVVVGIGIAPEVDVLLAAGATGANGVAVDAQCRTSLPDVFAIGDCAAHVNPFGDGTLVRLESVQNATDQAVTAAKVITGTSADYNSVPWFWSEQYDLRLQTVGLCSGHDEQVVRGAPDSRSFSVVYLKRGRVVALDCVNAPREYTQGRSLILRGATPDRALLSNPDVPLRAFESAH